MVKRFFKLIVFTSILAHTGLAMEQVVVQVGEKSGVYSIDIENDSNLIYGKIFGKEHVDYGLLSKLENNAKNEGFQVVRLNNDGAVGYQLDPSRLFPKILDTSTGIYRFLERFQIFVTDLVKLAENAQIDEFRYDHNIGMPSITMETLDGVPTKKLLGLFYGKIIYCLIPLLENFQTPSWVKARIEQECFGAEFPALISEHMPNTKLLLTQEKFENGESGKGYVRLSFADFAYFACRPNADGWMSQEEVDDYANAGWIPWLKAPVGGDSFRAHCRKFVITKVLPQLVDTLLKAAVDNRGGRNPISDSILNGIVKDEQDEQERDRAIRNKISKILNQTFHKPDFEILKFFQEDRDLNVLAIHKEMDRFYGGCDDYTKIMDLMLIVRDGDKETEFQKEYRNLPSSKQEKLREYLARFTTRECKDGINFLCIRESRHRFSPYAIVILNEGEQDQFFYSIGAIQN